MNKEDLIAELKSNYDDADDAPIEVNDELWTLADLFVRQWLNNGCDGYGMENVEEMYVLLCECKELLIEENMISESAKNNFNFPLWDDYNFDAHYRKVMRGD